jgi:hypothetical protein
MRVLLSVVAGIGLLAGPLAAQAPHGPVPVRAGLTAASSELRTANSATAKLRRQVAAVSIGETEWLKGGIIGALIVGVPLTLVWGELARHSDQGDGGLGGYLGGFVIAGGLGFIVGALVGAQVEK